MGGRHAEELRRRNWVVVLLRMFPQVVRSEITFMHLDAMVAWKCGSLTWRASGGPMAFRLVPGLLAHASRTRNYRGRETTGELQHAHGRCLGAN